jgi:hypothetical protein
MVSIGTWCGPIVRPYPNRRLIGQPVGRQPEQPPSPSADLRDAGRPTPPLATMPESNRNLPKATIDDALT